MMPKRRRHSKGRKRRSRLHARHWTKPAPPAKAPAGDRSARTLAGLALLAAIAAAFFAWDARQSLRSLESSAGGRLAELGAESAQSKTLLAQAQQAVKENQSRIGELEARVAESQEGRVTLEEMYRELSRSADDRVLSEVEQVCDRVGILRGGQLVHLQKLAEVKASRLVRARFAHPLETLPDLPNLSVRERQADRLTLEYAGELAPLLDWLAGQRVLDLHLEPLGLNAIYHRYHGTDS